MDKKRISLVIFGIVLISVILTIFLLPKNNIKSPVKTSVPTPIQQPLELCKPFSPNPGEISCQDAVNAVLEKYPGQVTKIDKKTVEVLTEKGQGTKSSNVDPSTYRPPQLTFDNKAAWVISITVNKEFSFPAGTTKILDVAISVKEKKILVVYPKFEK